MLPLRYIYNYKIKLLKDYNLGLNLLYKILIEELQVIKKYI
jgi:hypothetical protein